MKKNLPAILCLLICLLVASYVHGEEISVVFNEGNIGTSGFQNFGIENIESIPQEAVENFKEKPEERKLSPEIMEKKKEDLPEIEKGEPEKVRVKTVEKEEEEEEEKSIIERFLRRRIPKEISTNIKQFGYDLFLSPVRLYYRAK
jgi:hypothetical protein